MFTFIVRRLLWMVVLLFVISFLTFIIFYTLPAADPAALRAGRNPTPELLDTLRKTLGLDKPWYVQYGKYLDRLVFHFDFGYSYQNSVSVKQQIFDRLPATGALAIGGAIVWLLIGIPIGIISAIKRGTILDRAAMGARSSRSPPRCTGSAWCRCTSSPRTSASSRSSRARAPIRARHILSDPGEVIPA